MIEQPTALARARGRCLMAPLLALGRRTSSSSVLSVALRSRAVDSDRQIRLSWTVRSSFSRTTCWTQSIDIFMVTLRCTSVRSHPEDFATRCLDHEG